MDTKLHFKLFKAGKKWCVMGIATLAMATGLGLFSVSAHADATTPATASTTLLTTNATANQGTANQSSTTSTTTSSTTNATTPANATNQQRSNVDYNTPVNAGYLDGASADNDGNVVFTGWHATNQYQQGMHHFIIALNGANNQELYRTEATTVNRPDVGRVYPNAPIAAQGGFSVKIPASRLTGVSSVRLVSRYTTLANGQPANGADFWYSPVATNAGWLDTFKVEGNHVTVSGWHASDAAAAYPTHFLILFDRTAGHEVAHQIVTNTTSTDVANAGYKTTANGRRARFSATFDITPAMIGHSFALVSRYSDSTTANNYGHYADDIWFNNGPTITNSNEGWLDNFRVQGSRIVVSGWNANEMAAAYPTHFLILFDQTKNREVGHQIVTDTASSDVARVYPAIYNAAKSRFSATFNITPQMMGDTFVLVSRYSNSTNANSYGSYSDKWFNNNRINLANKQAAYLDRATVNPTNSTLTVSGWHAADSSAVLPYHYLILFDRTANREVARQEVNTTTSNDVARAYPGIANANKSRFAATFRITNDMIGHQLVLVSRYTDDQAHGEGNRVDNWYNNNVVNLNQSKAWLDTLTENGNSVHAAGWHAADMSVKYPHHYIILFDLTTNHELGRQEVTSSGNTDVARANPQIFNADKSRFDVTFNIPAARRSDAMQIISRYSDTQGGEGHYVQEWIPRWLNLYQNPSWMYQINYTQIQPQGPVGYNVGVGYEGIKTWFIKRALGTAGGYNQFSSYDASLVANVQRQHGLPATGVVDLNTWRALGYSPDLWYGIDSYVAPLGAHAGQGRQAHIEAMIAQAYKYMGKPYLVGSSSNPAYGTDCSGLVMQALYAGGINPTTCSSIYHAFPGNEWNSRQLWADPHFRTVPYWQRQRGDLVFYYEPGTSIIYHVAIYLGNDQVIESWPPRIMVSNIAAGYHPVIAGIRRVFN